MSYNCPIKGCNFKSHSRFGLASHMAQSSDVNHVNITSQQQAKEIMANPDNMVKDKNDNKSVEPSEFEIPNDDLVTDDDDDPDECPECGAILTDITQIDTSSWQLEYKDTQLVCLPPDGCGNEYKYE